MTLLSRKTGEAPHGLTAEAQTAGRGRRGHKWDSTVGNLLLSIVLRHALIPQKFSPGLLPPSATSGARGTRNKGLANEIGLQMAQRPGRAWTQTRPGILVEAARDNEGNPLRSVIGVNVTMCPRRFPMAACQQSACQEPQQNVPAVDMLSSMGLSRSYRRW